MQKAACTFRGEASQTRNTHTHTHTGILQKRGNEPAYGAERQYTNNW